MNGGFGLNAREVEEDYKEYIGKYVEIRPLIGHDVFRGKLVKIERGNAIFNPHYAQEHTVEGAEYFLKDKNAKLSLMVPFAIRPITREGLKALCALATEDAKRDVKKMREGKTD